MPNLALDAAYRATEYRVFTDPPLVLHVDHREPRLSALMAGGGAWLTACNPGSRQLLEAENACRMAALRDELRIAYLTFIKGVAIDLEGLWPDEPSLLVPGIDTGRACALARKHGQNALLLISIDATPRLHWLG